MDHLDEMPRAGRTGVDIAFLGEPFAVRRGLDVGGGLALGARNVADAGRQGVEDRVEDRHRLDRAADHHAVTPLQPPHATRHADVDVVKLLFGERLGAAHIVLPEAVAAIDDHVAGLGEAGDLVDHALRHRARGEHHPIGRRAVEPGSDLAQRRGADRAVLDQSGDRFRIAVEGDDLMAGAHQPPRHIAPHPAEADHPDFHAVSSLVLISLARLDAVTWAASFLIGLDSQ